MSVATTSFEEKAALREHHYHREASSTCASPRGAKDKVRYSEPELTSLPYDVQEKIQELEKEYEEGEVTEKGYRKKRSALLSPYLIYYPISDSKRSSEDGLVEPPVETLPKHVIKALEEIQRELDEEEITEKGFLKKRARILSPYMLKEPSADTLPLKIQEQLQELDEELAEGDITEKGHKKKRSKLMAPFLVPASDDANNQEIQKTEDSPSMVIEDDGADRRLSVQITEGGEKLFKCQICNEVFKQAQSFSGHCRLHRTERSKRYQCSICALTYTTRSHLKFHMYKHTGNFPYTCEFCGKGFAGRSQHRYHVLRHSGQSPYVCKFCGGRFWKKSSLLVHTEKHNRNVNGFFQCKWCHALFQSEREKILHLETQESCARGEGDLQEQANSNMSPTSSVESGAETLLQDHQETEPKTKTEDSIKDPENT